MAAVARAAVAVRAAAGLEEVVAMAVAVRAAAARAAEVARAVAAREMADLEAAAGRSVLNLRRPSSTVESVASPAAL